MTRNAVVVGSRRSQTVTVLLGAWVVGGMFVDGWAHFNRPGLETFSAPWHAILYSGAAVLFGWLLLGRECGRSAPACPGLPRTGPPAPRRPRPGSRRRSPAGPRA